MSAKQYLAPVVGLLLVVLLYQSGLQAGLANGGLDLLFRLRGPRPPDQRIVIVGVDEPSLKKYGAWPFPRRLHGDLLAHLALAQGVGFDFLFSEPAPDDSLFSRALTHGPPVVLAMAREYDGRILRPAATILGYHGSGHIETILAGDGIVRRVELQPDPAYTAFSRTLLTAAGLQSAYPADATRLFINFYGPETTFLYLSYADVLAGHYAPDFFRNRLVLIGAQAIGLGDSYTTSFTRERPTPGVEIQATIINNLLQQSFIRVLPWLSWLFIAGFGILAVTAWPILGERNTLLLNGGLILAVLLLAAVLFRFTLFFDYPVVLFFLFVSYLVHLVSQLLRATSRILGQARRLDRELDIGLQRVYSNIPEPFIHTPARNNSALASGIQRHLDRLQTTISALSLQHHFLENLLKEELPPLILWERQSGRPIFANKGFSRFWQQFNLEDRGLPDYRNFMQALAEKQAGETAADLRLPDEALHDSPYHIHLQGTGGRRFFQVSLHGLPAPETGFQGMLAVLQDVSELKELERVKDEVVAIVSHELKLPLTTILGYGEILTDALSGEHQFYAREICTQSLRLHRMIEDFLDIARLESGHQQVRRFPFPLNRMLEDAISTVRLSARKKDIEMVLNQPNRTTPLIGDESLLLQATINLLDNAVKFSPPCSSITVSLEEQPDRFVLLVADQGPGIPAEERLHIFDKFRRGRQTAQNAGFGLGLHLVKQIIDRHFGEIAVMDTAIGTTFLLSLPKQEPVTPP